MKPLAAAFVLAFASPALAAEISSAYIPITIDEADYKALQGYLGEQPLKFSGRIAAWLENQEQHAIAAKAAADDKAKADAQKAAPADPPKAAQ